MVPAGADHLRLRRRRQDAAHDVLRGAPQVHPDRATCRRTSSRRSWPSEDTRFYEHNGVDAKGIARAFVANQQAGGVSQGASTLTMQYVRMALRDGAKTPQEVHRGHRADQRPQAARDAARDRAGEADLQGGDPGALPQLGLLRPPGVRHLRRRPGLLLQAPGRARPGRGGHCSPAWSRRRRRTTRRASDQRAATDRRNYVIDQMAEDRLRSPRPGAPRAKPSRSSSADHPAERLRLGRPEAQRLGLLLRLLQELVDASSRRSARPRRSARTSCAAAATGWSPRSTRRSRRSRMKHVLDKEKRRQQVRARPGGRRSPAPAGSRRWR